MDLQLEWNCLSDAEAKAVLPKEKDSGHHTPVRCLLNLKKWKLRKYENVPNQNRRITSAVMVARYCRRAHFKAKNECFWNSIWSTG